LSANISLGQTKISPQKDKKQTQKSEKSTLTGANFSKLGKDTLKITSDTVSSSKPDIETTINYEAEDSLIMDVDERTAVMYNKANVVYGKRNISAALIDMDYKKNQITAKYVQDSTGKKIGVPIFKEGSETYEAGQIKYNYKTRKGQVKEALTKQGEGVIHSEVVRKDADNNLFSQNAIYTTCNLRDPHFHISATKMKLTNKRKIVTGPFVLKIDNIPTLIAFPFGIFPVPKRRGSGLIMPSYSQGASTGFVLRNGGFFWAANDYVGIKALADIYLSGSLRINPIIEYKSRYSFTGTMSLNFSNVTNNPDDPSSYQKTLQYQYSWYHSTLSKGTGRFAANVNFSSGKNYYINNSLNAINRQQNDFQSSVSYSNVIKKSPFSYQISARQSQNITSGIANYNLPTASFNMNRIYPLKDVPFLSKFEVAKKINFSFSSNINNNFSNIQSHALLTDSRGNTINMVEHMILSSTGVYAIDTSKYNPYFRRPDTLSIKEMINRFGKISNYSITNSIPLSTTFRLFKYFNFTPSINYTETYYNKELKYSYNNNLNAVKIDTSYGLKRTYKYSSSIGTTTRIFGTFYIKKWNLEAIRHTIVPTVSYSYTPDFSYQNITDSVQVGTLKSKRNPLLDSIGSFSRFDRFAGTTQATKFNRKPAQVLSFSVNNTFELKVRDKKDTSKVSYKKIMLLDNLSANGSYSFSADSFNLSNINISARTRILKIFDVNFSTVFDPYYYAYQGKSTTVSGVVRENFTKKKYFAWDEPEFFSDNPNAPKLSRTTKGIGNFVNANLSISARFSPKNKAKKVASVYDGTDRYFNRGNNLPNYVDWTLPWQLNVTWNTNYTKVMTIADSVIVQHYLTLNGNFALSPKWKIGYNTGYDFYLSKLSNTNLNFSRDLHCWYATLSWAPNIGLSNFNYFFFTIGVKASALYDLKIPRNSDGIRNP
jgi:hypothetical protein